MTPEELTYLAVLLCSIPAGVAFKGRGPRARQLGGAAVGGALALLTCGPHALHSLLTALGTWALLRLLPRRCGGAALAWTFGYLLFFRTPWLWGLPPPPPYANALQLLLTLKMVSLASDVQELRELQEAGRAAVTSEAAEELVGSLPAAPGLLELLCYSYCYLGLLTGPFYRFSTHRDWVRGPLPPWGRCWRGALARLRWAPAWGALGTAAARLFPLGAVREPAFAARPLPFRLFYMAPVFLAFRARLYVAWLCAEAACMAAAFGAYPPAARPRPGMGPSQPCPRPARAEEAQWDFEAIRTVDPLGTERGWRFREGLRRWNMTVQWWMAHYVHRRAPRHWHPLLRSGWTMLASAYWHGLHPGYYLSFLSVPLWLVAEGAGEAALAARGAQGARGARAARWLLSMRAFEYLGMGFVLLEARATLRYWASVYFCLHLLPLLLLLLLAPLAGRGERGGRRGDPARPDPPGAERGEGEGLRRRRREEGNREGRDPPAPGDPELQEEGGSPACGDPEIPERWGRPAPGDPKNEEKWGRPAPGDPKNEEKWERPAPGDPKNQEKWEQPTPGDPKLQEEGGSPTCGDPEIPEKWGRPAPGDPKILEKWERPAPGDPKNEEKWERPAPGDPKIPEKWEPPTSEDPTIQEGQDHSTPPDPKIQEKWEPPTSGDPTDWEGWDPPAPADPDIRGGHLLAPLHPDSREGEGPTSEDTDFQEKGEPLTPPHPDFGEGGDPAAPPDPDIREGGTSPTPRLRSRAKGAVGSD